VHVTSTCTKWAVVKLPMLLLLLLLLLRESHPLREAQNKDRVLASNQTDTFFVVTAMSAKATVRGSKHSTTTKKSSVHI
jgi:hypothetical protein